MAIRKRRWISRGIAREAWVADYVDQHGDRHIRTFRTKKDADIWMAAARHEIGQGLHTAASRAISVSEAVQRWIEHSEAEGLEFGTIRQRQPHLRLHVGPFIGREKLSDLTVPRIHEFDAQLRAAGRSLAMRRKVLTNLKTALSFAQGRGLVAQNVARGVRIKAAGREARGPLREGLDYPSRSELKALLDAAHGRWRPFLITAMFTEMRASELRGLTWKDVDLGAGIIHVRRRADAWRTIGPPKSKAGKRNIPLPPIAINALKTWQPECPQGALGLVFPNRKGNVEMHSNIWCRFWQPLQIRCGLVREDGAARYGLHALRHAAASLFIAHLGWSPKRVQVVLGHSSITMTFDRYGHLFEDKEGDREAMAKIEAAIVAA
jgi:integrase